MKRFSIIEHTNGYSLIDNLYRDDVTFNKVNVKDSLEFVCERLNNLYESNQRLKDDNKYQQKIINLLDGFIDREFSIVESTHDYHMFRTVHLPIITILDNIRSEIIDYE